MKVFQWYNVFCSFSNWEQINLKKKNQKKNQGLRVVSIQSSWNEISMPGNDGCTWTCYECWAFWIMALKDYETVQDYRCLGKYCFKTWIDQYMLRHNSRVTISWSWYYILYYYFEITSLFLAFLNIANKGGFMAFSCIFIAHPFPDFTNRYIHDHQWQEL